MTREKGAAQRYARAAGKAFEQVIGTQLEIAKQRGLVAWAQHAEPQFRILAGRTIAVGQGGADWQGFCTGGGMAFAIEAKTQEGDRYARNKLHAQQAAQLEACALAGGLALLALEFRDPVRFAGDSVTPPRRYAVPWRAVPWERARSADAVTAAALTAGGWEIGSAGLLDRFLARCPRCLRVDHRPPFGEHLCGGAGLPF